ncbi:MAG: NAD(P)-dependent oxidoreductase [Desulfamplus sp.]|nr:NAD(P)-dependent oxidoreductase [Desulfamplus sp.]
MKVLVTGATGFIGRHVVELLLKHQHEVIAVARDIDKARSINWFNNVKFVNCDLNEPDLNISEILGIPDVLVHLAWSGLPNYKDLSHFEINLPTSYTFIKNMITAGTKHILVAGTCFEYGIQNGPLSEDMPTFPVTPYGLAKDTLRKFLDSLQKQYDFLFQWVRLFYMYGSGQNPNSLMAQLDRAIDNKDELFKMSGGEQLRDYMPIEEIARRIYFLIENSSIKGVINCCSGKPISVRSLVEKSIKEKNSDIKLDLGYYPYPDYEPMAFWGVCNECFQSTTEVIK